MNKYLLLLKSYFQKKPIWQIEEGHVIVPAFISAGVQYYQVKDFFNTFTQRGLEALKIYEEWEMRCKKEDLVLFLEAMEKSINSKEIKLTELVDIIGKLKERLNFVIPTNEIIWKFASVAYFDRNESPYGYDDKYCKEKIERWKKAGDVDSFFLISQLSSIIPLPDLSRADFGILSGVIEKINDHHLQSIGGEKLQEDRKADLWMNGR